MFIRIIILSHVLVGIYLGIFIFIKKRRIRLYKNKFNISIYCRSYKYLKIHNVSINKQKLNNPHYINYISWNLLKKCIIILNNFMCKSISRDLKSRIIQSLFIQQIKLSKSILLLTGRHDLTGQSLISRTIIETAANIAWLLLSRDTNAFGNYIAHGLRSANDTINDINDDERHGVNEMSIQHRLKIDSFEEYRMAGLTASQIKYFLGLSHSQMNRKYPHVNAKQKIHMLNPGNSSYLAYSVASNETHANFADVVNRNTNRLNKVFIGDVNTNYMSSEPRIIGPISILLIHSFKLINKINGFVFINTNHRRIISNRLTKLINTIEIIGIYDEKLIQKYDS